MPSDVALMGLPRSMPWLPANDARTNRSLLLLHLGWDATSCVHGGRKSNYVLDGAMNINLGPTR